MIIIGKSDFRCAVRPFFIQLEQLNQTVYIAILNELWCKIPVKFSGFKNKLLEKFHKLMLDRFKVVKLKKKSF
ncbi:hypothetical protein BGP_5979 [Beggiatoa sp. PS]|nr:hypothetical protein BGP_5979 [Beggiatoa sp. PS]